jgi:hypothetical protein
VAEETEIGNLCREIGWPIRELARRMGCNDRTARGWAEYTGDGAGKKPPDGLVAWLRFIARTIAANPPPADWRVRNRDGQNPRQPPPHPEP